MTDIKVRNWYKVSKNRADGRINTCGMRIIDGQEVLTFARTADDVAQLDALQEYGYTVTHEIRNTKKKARQKN